MTRRLILIILALLCCFALLCACAAEDADFEAEEIPSVTEGTGSSSRQIDDVEVFEALCNELFTEWVTSDSVTMQFFVADPEAMGLKRPGPTFGDVMTEEIFMREQEKTAYVKDVLGSINLSALSPEQQLIYEILRRNIKISEILENTYDYACYTGYIRPLTGIQVQLPVLLAEFKFYTAQDIELYLGLLEDTVRYFDDIIAFERERAARGYFLNEANLGTVIEQLEAFLTQREDNLLITVTDSKIDTYPGLTLQQREQYKERNRELVLGNVLVAYDNLLEAMRLLRSAGGNPAGLAALKDGETVAHAMIQLDAGTDRTAEELLSMVSERRIRALTQVRSILMTDDGIMRKYSGGTAGQIDYKTPEEYLEILRSGISEDFPQIGTTGYTVLEVHESLQEFTSPAFFLEPAVDSFDDNVIYINPANFDDDPGSNLKLFTILAHEGYPGHLYERVLFRQNSPHPVRTMLSCSGYTEGWATYAEHYSYTKAGLGETEALFLSELNIYFLLLQSHIDIGVNLFNWDTGDIMALLGDDLGVTDTETGYEFFNSVTGVPLNISMYALGFIEIERLREEAKDIWGDDYTLLDFHSFILQQGPAPFSMLRSRLYN